MEFRNLEITVSSAKDLKDVNTFSKMDVYVIAMIAEDPRSKQKTPVDKDGGKSPKWNHKMKFIIDVSAAKQNRCTLVFQIKSDRSLGDRDIGEVTVHVKDLLATEDDGGEKNLTYKVILPSGKEKGTLNFSYKLGEKLDMPAVAPVQVAEKHVGGGYEPVMAYPAVAPVGPNYGYQQFQPQQQPGFGPPPPPQMYYQPPPPGSGPPPPMYYQPPPPAAAGGYGYPIQQGYPPQMAPGGYPPAAAAQYGYVGAQGGKQKKKKSGMGGLGMGLGAGLLGGLLIGDLVSDVGEMAAYDAGYDDAMGDVDFDF